MKPLKYGVSLTMDDDIINELKELSEIEDRSVSSYVNLVLRKHLNKRKQEEKEELNEDR